MTWKEAVKELAENAYDWAPKGMRREWHPANNGAQILELSEDGKRLYLEPADWAVDQLPTSVDLWSARGPRVRLVGPDGSGKWKVLTSDLVDMHRAWNRSSFAALCKDLLAV